MHVVSHKASPATRDNGTLGSLRSTASPTLVLDGMGPRRKERANRRRPSRLALNEAIINRDVIPRNASCAGSGLLMTDPNPVLTDVQALEKEFGLYPGFLEGLFKEDDWSFVIKSHAILEAAVAHVLTVSVGELLRSPGTGRTMSSLDRILPFLKPIEDLLVDPQRGTRSCAEGCHDL
jgi:hypothetical protein